MTESPRVLAYIRQSEARPGETSAAESLSLRSQEDRFRQWCEQNNAVPLGVIADHDLRGHDALRPGIQQLLDEAERLKPSAVWVLSLSRFARDHILQELVWRDLQARGVQHIISDIESGTNDPFIRGIYGLMHAKSRTEMSAHLRNAFARRARDGGFPVGPTPTGYKRPHTIRVTRANGTAYDRETGEPVIDPEGAAFIRRLFDRFDAGDSLHAIADDLARAGPGVRGGQWVPRTVRKMLSSPIYAGDITHQGVVVAHNDAWQIIERAQWDRVQARLSRPTPIVRNKAEHWLEGLVEHACGRRMYFQEDRRQGKQVVNPASLETHPAWRHSTIPLIANDTQPNGVYGCRTSWEPLRCGVERRMIGAKLLTAAVLDCLHADLDHLPTPARAAEMAQERCGGREWRASRTRIEKAHTEALNRWKRNHERWSAGKLPPAVMDAEDERLAEAERSYASAVAALPAPPDLGRITAAHILLSSYRDVLDAMTPDELRGVITQLGTVVVGPAGVRIAYDQVMRDLVPEPCVRVVPRWGAGLR